MMRSSGLSLPVTLLILPWSLLVLRLKGIKTITLACDIGSKFSPDPLINLLSDEGVFVPPAFAPDTLSDSPDERVSRNKVIVGFSSPDAAKESPCRQSAEYHHRSLRRKPLQEDGVEFQTLRDNGKDNVVSTRTEIFLKKEWTTGTTRPSPDGGVSATLTSNEIELERRPTSFTTPAPSRKEPKRKVKRLGDVLARNEDVVSSYSPIKRVRVEPEEGCTPQLKKLSLKRRTKTTYVPVEIPDEVSDTVVITAVMFQDMTGKRIDNFPFDINKMAFSEGGTGPYLQCSHGRLFSIARKAQYPDVTLDALKTLEPTTMLSHTSSILCTRFSSSLRCDRSHRGEEGLRSDYRTPGPVRDGTAGVGKW
ncbi:hypothetical protein VTO42DRAFT_8004 [Malbranchea cinnamomea]